MLVYVDDILNLAKDAQEYMLKRKQVYRLKVGYGPQYIYLGANINKAQLEDGRTVWSMTYIQDLQGSIKNIDSILEVNK